jgi:large conductance mechanosensitive channel
MANGKFWADFKAFAVKGNVIDMAVGVIVGGAFGKIISSLVNDILMPPLGMLLGGIDFKELKVILPSTHTAAAAAGAAPAAPASINYGMFVQNVLDFIIIAFCIFLFVRLIGKLKRKTEAAPAAKPADVALLEEIRDLLKAQKK